MNQNSTGGLNIRDQIFDEGTTVSLSERRNGSVLVRVRDDKTDETLKEAEFTQAEISTLTRMLAYLSSRKADGSDLVRTSRLPVSLPGTVGFTAIARLLSEHYGTKITRMRVYNWWSRKTENADGQPFPEGVPAIAPANRPNRVFDYETVLAWADRGVPMPHNRYGWQTLGSAS